MVNVAISTNFLIAISVIVFIFIVACIAFIIYKDKKEDQDEIDEIISDLVEVKPRKESVIEKREIINTEEDKKIDKVVDNKKFDIENMLEKMQKDLETTKEQVVSNFEAEQEEKAIISYQELIKNARKEDYQKEIDKHEREAEITASEVVSNKDRIKEKLVKKEKLATNDSKKFKNTEFISPIYGKMEENLEYPTIKQVEKTFKHAKRKEEAYLENSNNHILEETLNINHVSDEIKKNDEFLQALKEFRGNL